MPEGCVPAGGSSSWPSRLREKAAPPTRDYLLVFVGEGEDQPRAAAAIASTKGFERTAILEGGVEAFSSSVLAQVQLFDTLLRSLTTLFSGNHASTCCLLRPIAKADLSVYCHEVREVWAV